MFHKFAGRFEEANNPDNWGSDWSPPWMRGEGHSMPHPGPHFLHMRHHGFGGFGGPRGPFGQGERGRFFGRGDMKFALLSLLRERSMYGYEMIKALEERSGGFYSPSPGSIYPTLQMLEERGLVSFQEVEGKKVYSITESGRALLDEHQSEGPAGPPWMRHQRNHETHELRHEIHALRRDAMEVARLFAMAGRSAISNPAQLARLRAIIEQTRKELAGIIYGDASSSSSQTPPPPTE